MSKVVIYEMSAMYFACILFRRHPSLSMWRMQGLCLVSGFVEIRSPKFSFLCPSLLFKSNSHISSLVFIVSSSIPLYQLQSCATQVL